MRIFSVVAIIVALAMSVFSFIEGNVFSTISAISMVVAFIFLFFYAKNKSRKLINLFAVFLAIYAVFSLIRMFTEKGYF